MEFSDKAVEKMIEGMVNDTHEYFYTPVTLRDALREAGVKHQQATLVIVDMIGTSKLSYDHTRKRIAPAYDVGVK